MFEFLKRHKIKDRAELRQSLIERGHKEIPQHDSAEIDSVLSSDLSSHFEPSVDTSPFDTSPSIDPGGGFDGGGGMSGGGGSW